MRPANANFCCLVSALAFCPALMADAVFPAFKPVFVEPGDLVEQVIDIERRPDTRLEIRLLSPPDGAYLEVNDDGQLSLRWETGPFLPEQTQFMIQARNVDTGEVLETGELQVLSVIASPPAEFPVAEKATVSLGPMANQIVSTGRTVSISMNATSSDDKDPLISIDRVPQNAKFDKNPLGGYTLFWQTSDQDQGEHVFRITAKHPSETNTTSTALLTVFIGDPSRRKTLPAE